MNAVTIFSTTAAVAIGFAAGYLFRGESAAVSSAEPRPRRAARIAETKPAIRMPKESAAVSAVVTNTVVVTNGFQFGSRRMNPQEWLEDLKKNNPARFVEITNRMEHWRQRRLENAQSKLEFFSSIDTSGWSARSRATHDRLQELVAKRELIEQSLHDPDLDNGERQQLMEEMRATNNELRGLNAKERDMLFREAARALGVSELVAQEFSAAAREIIHATDNGFGGRIPPPPK